MLLENRLSEDRKAQIQRQLTYNSDTSIHGYSYRPDYFFVGGEQMLESWTSPTKVNSKFIDTQGVPMGFELELEKRHDCYDVDERVEEFLYEQNKTMGSKYYVHRLNTYANDVTAKINNLVPHLLYAKTDSSLDNGVEFVTQPMTLEVHKGVGYVFDKYNDALAGYQRSTTGMHIHIPKGAFTNAQLYLWMFFMDMLGTASVRHQKFGNVLTLIGQREFNNWARFEKPSYGTGAKHQLAQVAIDRVDHGGTRYKYVNYQNRPTLELRFFKANMLEHRILKNLEFADSTFEFVKYITSNDYDASDMLHLATSLSDYFGFLVSKGDRYSNLKSYLDRYRDRINIQGPVLDEEDTDALENILTDELISVVEGV